MLRYFQPHFCVVALILSTAPSFSGAETPLTIIATGETHAMLFPCDCPVNPGGGLAKRAYIVKSMQKAGPMLLLDAGGFSGGGIYDTYTEGRSDDSLRTLSAIRAMAAMRYDAGAIGDDDLCYGAQWLMREAKKAGLRLVSANCMNAHNTFVGAPYILVKKGKWTFAITGLTTQEAFSSLADSVVITPPFQALRALWPEMMKKADYRIVLSHLGEELSRMVLDSFPGCNVVVNGHRKNMTDAAFTAGGRLFMQFGFAGKSLSKAMVQPGAKGWSILKTDWVPVTPETPDDPAMVALLRSMEDDTVRRSQVKAARESVLDLYIMSQCPYGLKALKAFTEAWGALPECEWHVWFIGSAEADSDVTSLHGNQEVHDEMLWLAVQDLYPQRWFSFLKERASVPDLPTDSVLKRLKLDIGRLKDWADSKGPSGLVLHYNRSTRLGIHASPTLLLNNASFDAEITKPRLIKVLCGRMDRPSAQCDSVPECSSNSDCRKKGMVGVCSGEKEKAHCEYKEAVRFTFTVLMPDSLITHPESEVIGTTKELFEGALIETLSVRSEAGKRLLAQSRPKALPLYLFDARAADADNYSKIETGLEPKNNRLAFKEGYVKKAYFYQRPIVAGLCDLYLDPVFPGIKEALAIALKKRSGLRVRIVPLLTMTPDIDSLSIDNRLGREEAQRWLLLSEKYPPKAYRGYLESFLKRKDSSYWFLALQNLGINVDAFVRNIKEDNGRLRGLWKTTTELGISGPVEMVINNREVVRVKNPEELAGLLKRLEKE